VAIASSLGKLVDRGKLEASSRDASLARIAGSDSREQLATADLVVEAIAENLEIKTELYQQADVICKPGAILATTTSSMPVTKLGAAVARPEAVIGMHFFNPAPVMKLVEVVHTEQTAAEVNQSVRALCAKIGKVAVSCGDRAGFIVNALLFPYLNDAVRLLESGVAGLDEIDQAIKDGTGFPMGPFALLDVVGNDVSLAIQRQLHAEFGEPGFAPAPLLERMVAEGKLGRKTGEGFRSY
jgi:3-hydroxybutyryl-CoA dehydrogenase